MIPKDQDPLLEARIRTDSIRAEGMSISVKASSEQLPAIAERLQVPLVSSLTADLTAHRFRGGFRVKGRIHAALEQECVVTFEPVVQTIDEVVDRVFLPGAPEETEVAQGAEVFIDLEGEDLPDWFEGPELDLSELLLETTALAIDPYPRKPDAQIPDDASDEAAEMSPFAALKSLKSTNE